MCRIRSKPEGTAVRGSLKGVFVLAALIWLVAGNVRAADWEIWPDPTAMPPVDQTEYLGLTPTGEAVVTVAETDSSLLVIDVHQTRERDGKTYKAIQWFRDMHIQVPSPVPISRWLRGGATGGVWPPDFEIDALGFMTACRLVSIELDGEVVPIDQATYLQPIGWMMGDGTTWVGYGYQVAVRFKTAGTHTYKMVFRQESEFYYTECYSPCGLADPTPNLEGRRVLVPEQVGDPVDGEMVYSYTVTVVSETPTAAESSGWARVKAAAQE
jgi:hypothetical protein